jgi:hypothetical protein
VLSGVEVYLDTTEHAADGKQGPVDAIPSARVVLTLEPLGSMS